MQNHIKERNQYNPLKTFLSPQRLKNFVLSSVAYITGRVIGRPLPTTIAIETVKGCNFNCIMCKAGEFPKKFMDIQNFRKIVDLFQKNNIFLLPFIYGEPFLNKDIYGMLKYASSKNLFISVSSNFSLITPEVLKCGIAHLSTSIDAADKELFANIRPGGKLERVIKNLSDISELKKKMKLKLPVITINMVVMKENENQIEDVIKLGLKQDIKTFSFIIAFGTPGEINIKLPSRKTIDDIKQLKRKYKNTAKIYLISYYPWEKGDGGPWEPKGRLFRYCSWAYLGMTIDVDGFAYPCCIKFGEKDISFGNIFEDLKGVIERRIKFIKNFRDNPPETCKKCHAYYNGDDWQEKFSKMNSGKIDFIPIPEN